MSAEIYYRAECVFSFDVFEGPVEARIHFAEYRVIKRTPKGVWISRIYDTKRFVRDSSIKKYAYPTKGEALVGYEKRTSRYVKILEARLENAKQGLEALREGRVAE